MASKMTSKISTTVTNDLPKGWTCDCGLEHRFHPWVYAHWGIFITGRCGDEDGKKGCYREFEFRRGIRLREVNGE